MGFSKAGEQFTQVAEFAGGVECGHVLGFCGAGGYALLAARPPAGNCASHEEAPAGGGAPVRVGGAAVRQVVGVDIAAQDNRAVGAPIGDAEVLCAVQVRECRG